MTRKTLAAVLAVRTLASTGCSSAQGQFGRTDDHFVDDHGRVCTAVKWGDSASLDCDWPLEGQAADSDQ